MNSALQELKDWFSFTSVWIGLFLLGLVLGGVGAFDTHQIESLVTRIIFLEAFLLITGLVCTGIAMVVRGLTEKSAFGDFWLTAKIAMMCVPTSGIIARLVHQSFVGYDMEFALIMRSMLHAFAVGVMALGFMYWVKFRKVESIANKTGEAIAAVPTYMESEDHYLKIVRADAVEFVRANIGDMAEKFGGLGLRCHKSYWVSCAAIDKHRRDGRQLWLVLKDGTEIPVGRSYEKAIRAALA